MLLSLLDLPPEGAPLGMMNCRRGCVRLHLRYSIRIRRLDLLFFRDLRFRDLRFRELHVGARPSSLWAQPFLLLAQPSWLPPLFLLARRLRPLGILVRRVA